MYRDRSCWMDLIYITSYFDCLDGAIAQSDSAPFCDYQNLGPTLLNVRKPSMVSETSNSSIRPTFSPGFLGGRDGECAAVPIDDQKDSYSPVTADWWSGMESMREPRRYYQRYLIKFHGSRGIVFIAQHGPRDETVKLTAIKQIALHAAHMLGPSALVNPHDDRLAHTDSRTKSNEAESSYCGRKDDCPARKPWVAVVD